MINKYYIIILFSVLVFINYGRMETATNSEDVVTDDRRKKIESFLNKDKKLNLAPDISLKSYDDSLYILSELQGKVVLLNFWATWCGPCRMEIPDFNELYEKYQKDGFEILGISLSDSKKQLIDFSKTYGVKYPLLYGSYQEIEKITSSYGGVPAVPWSFLIGIDGSIVKTYPGAILKSYDPVMFQDLTYNIESQLKISSQDLE